MTTDQFHLTSLFAVFSIWLHTLSSLRCDEAIVCSRTMSRGAWRSVRMVEALLYKSIKLIQAQLRIVRMTST